MKQFKGFKFRQRTGDKEPEQRFPVHLPLSPYQLWFTIGLLLSVLLFWVSLSAGVRESDIAELVWSSNRLAFDLYQALRDESTDLFYSPYSISLALAMTYAGAKGDTEQEMADALHFTLPQERLHAAFRDLNRSLVACGENGLRLYIVSSMWGQADHLFLSEFLTLLNESYGTGLRELDFRGDPEGSREAINQWVSEETEGMIQELIPPGGITTLTRLVLGNGVYFKAGWLYPFDKAHTSDGVFHLLDGQEVLVPMMRRKARLGYAAGAGWQAIELPYGGGETAMVIFLPRRERFEEFESTLTAQWVGEIIAILEKRDVCLTMPKFAYEAGLELKGALTELGMEAAFQPMKADFSGIDGTRDLYLDEVFHKAFITVDEAGTEAAAATAAVISTKTSPVQEPCLEVKVDRPFFLLIRDVRTEVILFMGRVLDPR